jgi:hypothetical protein
MGEEFDPEAFNRRVKEQLKSSREAFDGEYKEELTQLAGLSRAEIEAIAPGGTDLQKYDQLIAVVKEASRINLEQAELAVQIKKLGSVAVKIAKQVPTLAAIL